ncbi:MAG: phosphotransferase family protein [Nocardioides sp.]
MWQPEPDWLTVPGGAGPSTVGVWRTARSGRALVVKRLAPPQAHDVAALSEPRHFAYWRRAADVASYGLVEDTPGLIGPRTDVAEDADGITLTSDWVEDAANSGLFIARSLGVFTGADVGHLRWLARGQLRDRISRVAHRGGWPTLARTTAADIVDALWQRRNHWLDVSENLPQVPQHGDPTPANLMGRADDRVVAVDWGSLGVGPVGADLGLYLLQAREEFEPLLDSYLLGLPQGRATREEAAMGARISAVYTVVTRAEWALARVAGGEGALASKFRHPAVAPHLKALQRQAPQIEALL